MDDLSREMFANPTITAVDFSDEQERVERACKQIFGRVLSFAEIAEMIAAPDGSEVYVTASGDDGDEEIELEMGYQWFNETHDYRLYVNEAGRRIVEFDNIDVRDDAPDALELRLFARQVVSFCNFGLDEIQLLAEGYYGHPRLIGYYAWARYGFRLFIRGTEVAETKFADVEDTLELFDLFGQEGAEWWYHNGNERRAVFYLEEGSECRLALDLYLREKGVNVNV